MVKSAAKCQGNDRDCGAGERSAWKKFDVNCLKMMHKLVS